MMRCIEIAKNGLGITAPNPAVGAVIVHDENIIGEGYTSAYGGAHAEVNAIQSVLNKDLLKDATLYVTLEPCAHFGKTPPCADLIIKHGIQKVVIGLLDPHKVVAGKGIQKLRDAGCDVTTGILEEICREHHKRFLSFHEKKRPYVILKWAETLDGFIAPLKMKRNEKPEPFWITSLHARQLVHQWRTEEQAILVGTTTVLEDNPKLTARNWDGENPIRIVLDKDLKINESYNVMDGSVKTIILTQIEDASKYRTGIAYEVLDFSTDITNQICTILCKHQINSVIVEGGAKTLQTFIDIGLWDEARVFNGTTSFEKGVKAPEFSGLLIETKKIGQDILKTYIND